MKKKDLALISETYARDVLNEAVPPFELGSNYESPDESKYKAERGQANPKGLFKAFNPETYKHDKGVVKLASSSNFGVLLTAIINKVGKDIVAAISDEGGRIEDSKQEAAERAGAIIQKRIIDRATGSPMFSNSQSKHLGRNVVDALERAGVIKELTRTRKGSGPAEIKDISMDDIDFGDDDLYNGL